MTDLAPDIAIGVMAYNEAANIGAALRTLLAQTIDARIARVVVVASGCTDETCAIVAGFARNEPRLILIEEPVRRGKAAAINTFLQDMAEPIVVIAGGDLVFEPTTLEALVAPFADSTVGMVGAHPVPVNDRDSFVGFAVNLMWDLHHRVALVQPKMGELVAFRKLAVNLDPAILSDELSIESLIRAKGLRVAYAPQAIVRNRGPHTLREFVTQRQRWCVANMQMAAKAADVSTLKGNLVTRAALQIVSEQRPPLGWLAFAVLIEFWCRLRATIHLMLKRGNRRYEIWEPLPSTKTIEAPPAQPASAGRRSQ